MISLDANMLERAWAEIRQGKQLAAGAVFLEKALVQGDIELSAAIRATDAMPGLIIRTPSGGDMSLWIALRLSGVHFDPVCQEGAQRLLPIFLADPDAAGIFAIFSSDLAMAIQSKGSLAARLNRLLVRIDLWIRFFRNRKDLLSDDEVRGLIAELGLLESLAAKYGIDAALEAWKGPAGALHDFCLGEFRIEVKSWTNQSQPRIQISNPSQTVIDPEWPIWLAALELTQSPSAGQSLPERIARLQSRMTIGQAEVFEALLATAGHVGSAAGHYQKRYSIVQAAFYLVGEGFPTIAPNSVPAGISHVKYALELNALSQFLRPSPVGPVVS
jgi:hypothetical protein